MKLKLLLIIFVSFLPGITVSLAADKITYHFSVLFLAKTCDVSVKNEIIIETTPGTGSVSSSDIKNDMAVTDVSLGLTNCTDSNIANSKVFISEGNTLTGTDDFFNDDPNSEIGLQITDGVNVFKKNTTAIPSNESVVWDNIMSDSETKIIKARLRCKNTSCEPREGNFSASLSFSYYIN
ncbi:fimbrial protein [Morganella morganii]|uniref:fimbrial protein n=1 Tax=Morganella morganii TaxID=582 RepID=UPI0034E4894D